MAVRTQKRDVSRRAWISGTKNMKLTTEHHRDFMEKTSFGIWILQFLTSLPKKGTFTKEEYIPAAPTIMIHIFREQCVRYYVRCSQSMRFFGIYGRWYEWNLCCKIIFCPNSWKEFYLEMIGWDSIQGKDGHHFHSERLINLQCLPSNKFEIIAQDIVTMNLLSRIHQTIVWEYIVN